MFRVRGRRRGDAGDRRGHDICLSGSGLCASPTCAESGVWPRQINALDEKSKSRHYILVHDRVQALRARSGGSFSDRRMRLGNTMPRRSRSAASAASGWATQRNRISPRVAVGKTTSWDWMRASSSRIARGALPRPRALLPHLEALPEHESEEANEDVSLDAVLALMPDRAQVQLILLNAERRFGLGELDVSLPELLVAPIGDVRAQEIGALRERGPIVAHSGDLERLIRSIMNTDSGDHEHPLALA